MGNCVWLGWQTSVEDAPQPIGIIFGVNLRRAEISTVRSSAVLETRSEPAAGTSPASLSNDQDGQPPEPPIDSQS